MRACVCVCAHACVRVCVCVCVCIHVHTVTARRKRKSSLLRPPPLFFLKVDRKMGGRNSGAVRYIRVHINLWLQCIIIIMHACPGSLILDWNTGLLEWNTGLLEWNTGLLE